MSTYTPAAERALNQMLCAPYDLFAHEMAAYLLALDDVDRAREFLITVMDEDPADSEPAVLERRLWPLFTVTALDDIPQPLPLQPVAADDINPIGGTR